MNSTKEPPSLGPPQAIANGGWPVCLLDVNVQAGFPSPAEDHAGRRIDVLEHLVKHPQVTYQMRVRGESMREIDIHDGDVVGGQYSIGADNP